MHEIQGYSNQRYSIRSRTNASVCAFLSLSILSSLEIPSLAVPVRLEQGNGRALMIFNSKNLTHCKSLRGTHGWARLDTRRIHIATDQRV
ncbi:hypothetical protein BDW60DRAFT_200654 [Aspergillus nidulans var. acristatus]